MPRPGASFSFETLATSLRGQASQQEITRRLAASGDVVKWDGDMGSSGTAPLGLAGITGFYVRTKDLVFSTFTVTATAAGVGTGVYALPIPVPAYWNAFNGTIMGAWVARRGTNETDGRIIASAANPTMTYRTANPGTIINVGPAAPYAWTTGDVLEGWMLYLASKAA